MTISSDRQTVLDFTQPYMTFGLAFMMRVQEVKVNYFRFLLPFSQSMWIAICVLVMVMGFLVWICSLFSPWGYYGRCLQVKPSKQVNDVHFVSDFLSLHGKGDYFCAQFKKKNTNRFCESGFQNTPNTTPLLKHYWKWKLFNQLVNAEILYETTPLHQTQWKMLFDRCKEWSKLSLVINKFCCDNNSEYKIRLDLTCCFHFSLNQKSLKKLKPWT